MDPNLTGRENLALIGRLSRVSRKQAKARADELLDSFGLTAVSDPEAAQAAGVPVMFLLVFTSCAFVPLSSMPGWLQAIGAHQPVNALVTAERALILGGPAAHDVLISLEWSAGILLASAILAARTYARMGR